MGDCDGDPSNGCETTLDTNDHCGACGTVCGSANTTASACTNGTCALTCAAGFDNCNGDPADGCEADLSSPQSCGSCSTSCSMQNGTSACVQSACEITCTTGFGDCNADSADGCESDLVHGDHTCGSCTTGCAGTCGNGTCNACDSGLALDSNDAMDAAKAMGLCADVVSARWVLPNGNDAPGNAKFPLGHGILSGFGANVPVRDGASLLALSSGTARQPTDPGYSNVGGFDKGYTSAHPAGFPLESAACPGVVTGTPHDGIGLEVVLQVPDWAKGFTFDFDFYTYEWPNYICSQYNDFFVALMSPIPAGQVNGNISFDSQGNPISVNNALVDVCSTPGTYGGKQFMCSAGGDQLAGTGFESGAATGWLRTQAPAEPSTQITLRFAVYDSGDGVLDSTTLIDNFRWLPEKPMVGTTPIF